VTPSRRLRQRQVKNGWIDTTDCVGPCYPTFVIFNVLFSFLFLFWVCVSGHVPTPGALSGSDFHFPALFLVLILAVDSISCLPVPFGFLQVEASAYFGQICSLGSTSVLLRASAPPLVFLLLSPLDLAGLSLFLRITTSGRCSSLRSPRGQGQIFPAQSLHRSWFRSFSFRSVSV
jgi:hypothetical protein